MPTKADEPANDLLNAANTIYKVLAPLDEGARRRVIASAFALLGSAVDLPMGQGAVPPVQSTPTATARPTSPIELLREKQPSNNAERIALFAYYREKVQGQPRFAKGDLEKYFAPFGLPPAKNYDRDFKIALQLGYIYEDGADSYLTTKGLEAVETGFSAPAPRGVRTTKRVPPRSARKKT